MSDHDPLCPAAGDDDLWAYCQCELVAQVRADERERIAQAIGAYGARYNAEHYWPHLAARIARGEG